MTKINKRCGIGHATVTAYHMMLTEREHLNVFDDDHLIVALIEDGIFDGVLDGVLVALREEQHRLGRAKRSCNETCELCVSYIIDPSICHLIFDNQKGSNQCCQRVEKKFQIFQTLQKSRNSNFNSKVTF